MARKSLGDFINEGYDIDLSGNVWSRKSNKYLAISKTTRGYCYVGTSTSGTRKNYFIHRLIAEKFIPNPDNKPCVNHKDSNPANNDVSNLEWCTHSENTAHGIRAGHINQKKPEEYWKTKTATCKKGHTYADKHYFYKGKRYRRCPKCSSKNSLKYYYSKKQIERKNA